MKKNLLDVECILLGEKNFKCDYNGYENIYTSDYVWDIVHRKKINYIDVVEGEFLYIEFESGYLVVLLDEGTN